MSKRNIYDSGSMSKLIQKNLKKSKKKYDTYDILCTIKDSILSDFEYANISIDLCKTELNIISTKKENNYMKEIKDLIMNELYDLVDSDDIELLFEVNANKNNICVRCKRKIEH